MRTPIKLGAAAVAGILAVGGLGAVTAIGESAETPSGLGGAWSAAEAEAHTVSLASDAEARGAVEFAGAFHDDRLADYALVVYVHEVEQAEAAATAARTAATGGGGAGGHLASIRACESGGNYGAVSPSGQYRGAYQFDYGTWASVGGSGDPAAASPGEQDMRAGMLLARSGSSPWPNCG